MAAPLRSPSRRLAARRWLAAAVAGALVLCVGLVVRHRLAPKHFEVVEPGVLYRSATLPPGQLLDVVDAHGIRTVVNLRSLAENREPWYAAQRRALDGAGVEMVDLPLDYGTPPDAATEAQWWALLGDPSAQPILVHCQYGVLRTGIMVSAFEVVSRAADPDGLFDRGPLFGHDPDPETRARVQRYLDDVARRHRAGTGTRS